MWHRPALRLVSSRATPVTTSSIHLQWLTATTCPTHTATTHRCLHSFANFNKPVVTAHRHHAQRHQPPHRHLFIQTQSTPNPSALKFLPQGQQVLPPESGQTAIDFPNYKSAQISPLASALFQIDGVVGVMLATDFVSINVEEGTDWNITKPHVYGIIMDFFASGKPVLNESVGSSDTTITDEDDEIVSLIKELIETRIRPAVQEDGGDIVYKGMNRDTGVVSVQMVGSCKGCSSSSVTLKSGIENMLMHYVPEVASVEEYIDPEQEALNQVSDEQLKKLEQGLKKVKGGTATTQQ